LKTSNNEEITANVGQYLELAGPDFFNAKLQRSNVGWKRRDSPKIFDWYVHIMKEMRHTKT
jgi:hypothetical protein